METILIATLGAAAQVVTLALDALLANAVPVTRVIVIHTDPAHDPIRRELPRLRAEFLQHNVYQGAVIYQPHLLAGDDGPLSDVATPDAIDAAFQSFYTLLRQSKQAGYTIHLLPVGGRKTMTVFAMAVAQILLDESDHLWYMVSPPPLITSQAMHAAHPEAVTLVPVPLAHWGRLRPVERTRAQRFLEEDLTPAERDVAYLLVTEGLANAALAQRLGKSTKTIANQLSQIYAKFDRAFELDRPADRALLLTVLGKSS